MSQPARTTFWRGIFLVNSTLPFLTIWQLLELADDLDVLVASSRSWMGIIAVLGLVGLVSLLLLLLICFRPGERILSLLEAPARIRWFGLLSIVPALIGFTLVFSLPFIRDLLGDLGWMRFLVFWAFSLVGMYGLKAIRENTPWLTVLLVVVLFQTGLHLLLTQLSVITSYPFSMGWSETSRYYYPSLYLSDRIYGSRLPWPILHPSLHLLLVPPYLFEAPLWAHRFWQVFLRLALLGLTAQALIRRLAVQERLFRWLLWVWMVLYLFQGPIYFHLAVPLIVMLWGFSKHNHGRTLIFLLFASVWSGLSRINWYPMPGILASVLYLLEVPYEGKRFWRYLSKPVFWFIISIVVAVAAQRVYIALSGIPNPEFFYTSLTSNLLWYRLFPNASYSVGVLPAALIASLPMWLIIAFVLHQKREDIHPLRLGLLFSALLVLFVGGLVVSMKIGGGVDIHNLDAYLGLLLVITAYLVLCRYAPEDGGTESPLRLPWGAAVLLVAVPAWFLLGANAGIRTYDQERTDAILDQLQARVDLVDTQGGEVLFITQRHLVSMHMLENVSMVPEYEREELMEMAMGNNRGYLRTFSADMERHRFEAIVVDPLSYRLLGKKYPFGEENNAWVQRVMKSILCNYREADSFPQDQVAIYVPQEEPRQCP